MSGDGIPAAGARDDAGAARDTVRTRVAVPALAMPRRRGCSHHRFPLPMLVPLALLSTALQVAIGIVGEQVLPLAPVRDGTANGSTEVDLSLVQLDGHSPVQAGHTGRRVSWWFSPAPKSGASRAWSSSGNATAALELLRRHGGSAVATSLLLYCGDTIAANGSFVARPNPACDSMSKALREMGIGAERVIQANGPGGLPSLRRMFDRPSSSIEGIARMATTLTLQGVSWDIEPHNSTAADATQYSAYMARLRAVLTPLGVRLTSYSNVYDPVIANTATLQHSVDKILIGDTYNFRPTTPGETNFSGWLRHYHAAVNANISRAKIGVAVLASTLRGDWNCGAGGMSQRLRQLEADNVHELAIFMLKTSDACDAPAQRNDDGDLICPCSNAWLSYARQFLATDAT